MQTIAAARRGRRATLERQRALAKDGITTNAALTGAEAAAAGLRGARQVGRGARSRRRARACGSPRKRSRTPTCARRSTAWSSRSARRSARPCRRSASPVRRRAKAARLRRSRISRELEVQTEVSENSVAKLLRVDAGRSEAAGVSGSDVRGRLRQIFPSADRAKSIVEVRVTILDADAHVKPEMTASVTFTEHAKTPGRTGQAADRRAARAADRPRAQARDHRTEQPAVRLGRRPAARRRDVR